MSIITDHTQDIRELLDKQAGENTVYGITDTRIIVIVFGDEIDRLMFVIVFAGWFLQHPVTGTWIDDEPINRMMIDTHAANQFYGMINRFLGDS
jgi:hypothetical protein